MSSFEEVAGQDPYAASQQETTRGSASVQRLPGNDLFASGGFSQQGGFPGENKFQQGDKKQFQEKSQFPSGLGSLGETTAAASTNGILSEWSAKQRPAHEQFYYRPTSFQFRNTSLEELVAQIYQFCDREFEIEIESVNPDKGTFNLAVFVNVTLVMMKLRIWRDSGDVFVLEVELRDGCCINFGEVYRKLKSFLQPDTLSRATTDELDFSVDKLLEYGNELPAPTAEEWDSILVECEIEVDEMDNVNVGRVTQSIESLCSIGKTYEAGDLEYLAQGVAAKKIGFVHPTEVSKPTFQHQQVWAVTSLVKHLCEHPQNVEHLKALLEPLAELISTACVPENHSKCWFTCLNAACQTYCEILKCCKNLNISVDSMKLIQEMPSVPIDETYKYCKEMVEERKLNSRSISAENHLKEALMISVA